MWQRKGRKIVECSKRGIMHNRERIEKTNHTWEIKNIFLKAQPPHKEENEKCPNKICRPVEEENWSKLSDSCNEELVRTEWQKIELNYIYTSCLFAGGFFGSPAKGCKFEERKRKEKKKEERTKQTKTTLGNKKGKEGGESSRKKQRIFVWGKQNSQAVMFP